jgi:hypothetical protein
MKRLKKSWNNIISIFTKNSKDFNKQKGNVEEF